MEFINKPQMVQTAILIQYKMDKI